MATARNGKQLRFAAPIRVSTIQQEERGESLRTQKSQLIDDVSRHNGEVVSWYGGQEHATVGHATPEVDRSIADARKGKFDAVIVAHQDRWSRDNAKSKAGIQVLRQYKIRFFVRSFEYDLNNPTHRFQLAMSAEIGELQASTQNQKSLENRIARARGGVPTTGRLPFGRIFRRIDKDHGEWSIDKERQRMIRDVAKRYLAGESLADLATEYRVNHANLHKNLTQRCGEVWEQRFHSDELMIDEKVVSRIPRLLPEKTIQAILKRVEANKTFARTKDGPYFKNKYLLSGLIFCDHCGYSLFGQTNHADRPGAKKRYYRHAHKQRDRPCSCIDRRWIEADRVEGYVLAELLTTFGNPAAMERAIQAAIPNADAVADLRRQRLRLTKAIAATKSELSEAISLRLRKRISDREFDESAEPLRQDQAKQEDRLHKLDDQLGHLPSTELIHNVSQDILKHLQRALFPTRRGKRRIPLIPGKNGRLSAKLWASVEAADSIVDSWSDRRALVEAVLGGKTPEGQKGGVFIRWSNQNDIRRWGFSIRGIIPLIEPQENELDDAIVSASHSPGITPR